MTRTRDDMLIVLIDSNAKRWPAASKLVELGVPLKAAREYAKQRRDMTVGLKRRVALAKN